MEVYNRKVIFEAVKQGEIDHGYVGLDNVNLIEPGEEECITIPESAQVSTIPPDTTTAVPTGPYRSLLKVLELVRPQITCRNNQATF